MKVITEPKITVISVPTFIEHPEYKIPDDGTHAEKLGAFAAKGCYGSYGKDGRANIANQKVIIESKHGSVTEHSNFSIFTEGITRGCSLEINRHRGLSISQRSTRYTSEEDAAIVLDPYYASLFKKYDFYHEPPGYMYRCRVVPKRTEFIEVIEMNLIKSHLDTVQNALMQYEVEINDLERLNPLKLKGTELRKWCRGKARNVISHDLETKATYTANIRTWRWIIELRTEKHAEAEIRRWANLLLYTLRPYAPTYFEDFENIGEYDGIPQWKPIHSKI